MISYIYIIFDVKHDKESLFMKYFVYYANLQFIFKNSYSIFILFVCIASIITISLVIIIVMHLLIQKKNHNSIIVLFAKLISVLQQIISKILFIPGVIAFLDIYYC